MGWLLAGAAEVVGVAGDGLVEMPEPDPVHDGTGGERVLGAGDPFGEGLATPFDGFRNRRFLHVAQYAEYTGLHLFSGTQGVSAREDAGLF